MTKRLTNDENAVSISVGTMLLFSVTVVTLILVVNSFYSMMDREGSIVTRNQFEIHGNDMALQIANIDTAILIANNHGGKVENLSYRFSLPSAIADKQYSVEIKNDTSEIVFSSEKRYDTTVKVSYVTSIANVSSTKMYSGPDYFEFYYNSDSNLIELR